MAAENPRPLAVTILAWVYIVTGVVGFSFHLGDFRAPNVFAFDGVWIELVRFLAFVAGVFMLRGQDWARWLAIAWMAFHVVVGALNGLQQFAVHCLFCAIIAWFLLRPGASRYFRGTSANPA